MKRPKHAVLSITPDPEAEGTANINTDISLLRSLDPLAASGVPLSCNDSLYLYRPGCSSKQPQHSTIQVEPFLFLRFTSPQQRKAMAVSIS